MSGLKVIRRRLFSVKNTRQITKAMKLVSAAKLKKAQDAAIGSRKFSIRFSGVLSAVISQLPENVSHTLTQVREVKRCAYVVFSGERGLCGAFNQNVAKAVLNSLANNKADNIFYVIGRRAELSAKKYGWNTHQVLSGLGEDVAGWPLDTLGSELIDLYERSEIDEVRLIYTKFISTMNLLVTEEKLLPFSPLSATGEVGEASLKKIKIEPDPEIMFPHLLPLVIRAKLFQCAFESKACEHAARMTSMDSATRNADELIQKLLLFYNRARQRVITAELLDILGGAEAQKN